jgi:hypothetical protein
MRATALKIGDGVPNVLFFRLNEPCDGGRLFSFISSVLELTYDLRYGIDGPMRGLRHRLGDLAVDKRPSGGRMGVEWIVGLKPGKNPDLLIRKVIHC